MNAVNTELANKKVGFFVTCLANTMRPSVGFASLKLLEDAGCYVEVPSAQSCCGQPAFNSGDDEGSRQVAEQFINEFESYDYIVVPSGSCAGMVRKNFPDLFSAGSEWKSRAEAVAQKTYELLSFLVDICDFEPENIKLDGTYTYHDSCSGLRTLNVYELMLCRELPCKIFIKF